jgi:hypothetical protein
MSDTTLRPSATIYQFPAGGRASLRRGALRPMNDRGGLMTVPQAPRMVGNHAVVATACWYHDAAITEANDTAQD